MFPEIASIMHHAMICCGNIESTFVWKYQSILFQPFFTCINNLIESIFTKQRLSVGKKSVKMLRQKLRICTFAHLKKMIRNADEKM